MESQIETVLGSRKQKTALSGERRVSDIQMGAWEQPALRLQRQQRGEGDHREGEQSQQWTLDSPGTGGKKEEGELGSVGIPIVRYTSLWIYTTSASASACVPALTLEMWEPGLAQTLGTFTGLGHLQPGCCPEVADTH